MVIKVVSSVPDLFGGVLVNKVPEREWVWNQETFAEELGNLVDGRNEITQNELISLLPEADDRGQPRIAPLRGRRHRAVPTGRGARA